MSIKTALDDLQAGNVSNFRKEITSVLYRKALSAVNDKRADVAKNIVTGAQVNDNQES